MFRPQRHLISQEFFSIDLIKGIGGRLIKWGTDQADRDGLETYLDGSEVGQPYYMKHHGFQRAKSIPIPDRPEYGSYAVSSCEK